jgi:phosphoserine phosphatase RsbU/P
MTPESEPRRPASLIVVDPGGHRKRVEIGREPFRIGRHADNDIVLRDSRASRSHARIVFEDGRYFVEDAGSRHGVSVNGKRVERHPLASGDRIEFGVPDSYEVVFGGDGGDLSELVEHTLGGAPAGAGGNLAKLRAILEVARTLQTGFSLDDVLNTVVDAALAITGAERGFLLLRDGAELETRVARAGNRAALDPGELRVPRRVIRRALDERRDLFSMNFDPLASSDLGAGQSVSDLELRSCVCVPLVRIQAGGSPQATSVISTAAETIGVLYMDSRISAADLAGGNRELLQSLAIEASTVLENARLLDEERVKRKMEEELRVARDIQQGLLPRALPLEGWFRVAGSSTPSHQVGGDWFDVVRVGEDCWSAVAADVSGKGVSAALLAGLLQGAFLAVAGREEGMERRFSRLNHFLNERTGGEKYATVFYCAVKRDGGVRYVNAGHCAPLLVTPDGALQALEPTGLPIGLIDPAEYEMAAAALAPGAKIVVYTDGITEAESPSGEFFGRRRLRDAVRANAALSCVELHAAIGAALCGFTRGAPQADDLTLLVLEYQGA